MKLTIELVPKTSWYNNVRSLVSSDRWDKIRNNVYSKYEYKCGICNAEGPLHCHEIWNYDDINYIQRLDGFIALCEMCHHCKHIGLAQIMSKQGKLDIEKVYAHFEKVNQVDRKTLMQYLDSAFKQWYIRSGYWWKLDLDFIRSVD